MLQAADVWFGYGRGSSRIATDRSRIREDPRESVAVAVVRGISLDVPSDGFVGLLGPNGAGKTTLLRLLAGTRQPQRGSVTLDGRPLSRFSRAALARRVAVVPQETHLAFDYSVAEVAMMGRYPHLRAFEIEGPLDVSIVERALAATGTLQLKDRLYATLSGGEKQRVIVAAALAQITPMARIANGERQVRDAAAATGPAHERGILLLDEPTASLDLAYQLEVAALLRTLHEERGTAVVLATHDLNLAASLCRTLVLMKDGVLLASGPTDDVLSPENIRRLYGVEADVLTHRSGHRVVVPVKRIAPSGRA